MADTSFPIPQRPRRAGDRDRRARVQVRWCAAAVRSPAHLSRHGRRPKSSAPIARRSTATIRRSIRMRRGRRPVRWPEAASASLGRRGDLPQHCRRRRRDRRTDRRAGAGAARLPCLGIRAGERLEETGAGIQLSPNATRVLIGLGLAERLAVDASRPKLEIRSGARAACSCASRSAARGAALRRALLGRPSRRSAVDPARRRRAPIPTSS